METPKSAVKRLLGRVALTLGCMFVYVLLFLLFYSRIGPGIAALTTIPVIIVGWLWGLRGGLLAGLLSLPLNVLLFNFVGLQGWDMIFRGTGGPGSAAGVLLGAVVGLLSDLRGKLKLELTERKRAEEERRNSEAKFRGLFENVPDGVYQSTPDGKFLTVNPAFVRMFGYDSEEELLSIDIEHDLYVNPEERKAWKRELEEKGELRNFEATFRRKDGQEINVLGNTRAVCNEHGAVLNYEGTITDITVRKRLEEALREREDQFRLTFELAPIGMALVTPDGRFLHVNGAYCDIVGYSSDELLNRKFSDITHPDDLEANLLLDEKVLEEEIPHFQMEKRYIHKTGEIIDVIAQVALVRDPKGQPLHFIAQVVDITNRKQAEERLFTYQEQLRALASRLSLVEEEERQQIATELHDRIGQTLSFCNIKLGALRESVSSTGLSDSVDEIRELIEQTIDDTQSLIFDLSPPVLHELGFEAAVRWLARKNSEQHGITFDIEDGKQPKPLNKDIRDLLFRALSELLVNVVKHAQAQNVKISILRDSNDIEVSIKDDGIGFNTFMIDSQLSITESFGLFSIRERLDHVGGHLKIESQSGHGTQVTLIAPLKCEEKN